jgi:hypothetical protein
MKIRGIKNVQGCLEGTNVRDIYFDEPITTDFAEYVCKLGRAVFRREIEKPFFKVMVRGRYTLKGSVGNYSARLILPTPDDANVIAELNHYFDKF